MHYRMHFGRRSKGIWLPECGTPPGIDRYLAAENIRFFFVGLARAGQCRAPAAPRV